MDLNVTSKAMLLDGTYMKYDDSIDYSLLNIRDRISTYEINCTS